MPSGVIRSSPDSPVEEAGFKLLVPLRGLVPIAASNGGRAIQLRMGTPAPNGIHLAAGGGGVCIKSDASKTRRISI
jgi:hypothetical protein